MKKNKDIIMYSYHKEMARRIREDAMRLDDFDIASHDTIEENVGEMIKQVSQENDALRSAYNTLRQENKKLKEIASTYKKTNKDLLKKLTELEEEVEELENTNSRPSCTIS